MSVKLLKEHHLEFLSLKGGCSGTSESVHVKMLLEITCHGLYDKKIFTIKGKNAYLDQGCGNTMPNLSDLVPFHSGQVENFNLLVLGQVQNLY